ncbi:MAG: hypothetical protein RL653_440 [Pseudomonadota bacterium]|jgi:WD40 repeat protein
MSPPRPKGGRQLACLALSPNGRWLYAAHAAEFDDRLRLINERGALVVTRWDLERGERLARVTTQPVKSPALVALGDTPRVLVAHGEGAFVLDTGSGAVLQLERARNEVLYGPPVVDAAGTVALAPSLGARGVARLSLDTGAAETVAEGETGAVALSPSGGWMAVVQKVPDKGRCIRILDVRGDRLPVAGDDFSEAVWDAMRMVVDDSGQVVAWASGNGIYAWTVGQPAPVQLSRGAHYGAVHLAFRGEAGALSLRVLAEGPFARAELFDLSTGRSGSSEKLELPQAVALSLEGGRWAYGTLNGLHVRDPEGAHVDAGNDAPRPEPGPDEDVPPASEGVRREPERAGGPGDDDWVARARSAVEGLAPHLERWSSRLDPARTGGARAWVSGLISRATGVRAALDGALPGEAVPSSGLAPARLGKAGGDISAVGFAVGPQWVVTGSRGDGVVDVWDRAGQPRGCMDTGASGITAFHALGDGERFVYMGVKGELGTCRPRDGAVRRWATPFVYASQLALEPGGRHAFCVHCLVDGMRGKSYGRGLERAKQDVCTVWNADSGTLVAVIDHMPQLGQSAEWLADGSGRLRLRVGLSLHLVSLPTGEVLRSSNFRNDWHVDHPSPRIVPGGHRILTTAEDTLVAWDIETRRIQSRLCEPRFAKILALDARGELGALRTPGRGAFVARLEDGTVALDLQQYTGGEAVALAAFGASGRTLALVLEDQSVRTVEP